MKLRAFNRKTKKAIKQHEKKTAIIMLFMLFAIIIVAVQSCNLFDEIFTEKEPEYKAKNMHGMILLPETDLKVEEMYITSVYDEISPDGLTFDIQVESAPIYQSVFLSNRDDEVLMLCFLAPDETIVFSSEKTASALVMMTMQAYTLSVDEWKKLEDAIFKNKHFPAMVIEIEKLVSANKNIFDETNTSLMHKCFAVVDDFTDYEQAESITKSQLTANAHTPLEVSQSGKTINITNNGKAPAYMVTVSKDGKETGRKKLDASTPVKMSIGSIITWKWGAFGKPNKPVSFNLNQEGTYYFYASSGNLSTPIQDYEIIFENMFTVCHSLMSGLGLPIKYKCLKAIIEISYDALVTSIVSVKSANGTAREAAVALLDIFFSFMNKTVATAIECDDQKSNAEKLGKYLEKIVSAGKFVIKSADVLSKIEGGTNAAGILGFWLYQPSPIEFCKLNMNNQVSDCEGKFNAVSCYVRSNNNFIQYNNSYSTNSIEVGNAYTMPQQFSFTSTQFLFKASLSNPFYGGYNNYRYEIRGLIRNDIITAINIEEYYENILDGITEITNSKKIGIRDLTIPLSDIKIDSPTTIKLNASQANLTIVESTIAYYSSYENKLITSSQVASFDTNKFKTGDGEFTIVFNYVAD